MKTLEVLRVRPEIFFRLAGIRVSDFDVLVRETYPLWIKSEHKRLTRKGRKRAIGGGMAYRLEFSEQLLLCLIYYRTYVTHVFLGLFFSVSSPTVCRRIRAMTVLLAGHFRMPERKVRLTEEEQGHLLYLMIDGTERPVLRPAKPGARKRSYSGKKKRHTAGHQIVTTNNKRIVAVGPAQEGRKHDKKIYDESQIIKPADALSLGDSGYQGTTCEVPIKKQKHQKMSKENKAYNKWHARLRVGVEHAIGRMKKFNIFSGIFRNNGLQNLIAKNIGALANINLKTA
jgi:hypothetical protein